MSREPILVCLGVLVLIAPFSGLPLSWLSFILPALGVLIVFIGVTLTLRKNRLSVISHESSAPLDA